MAQYYRDFADADGISDWTEDRYASGASWSVAAGVLSGGTAAAVEALTWNDIDADADRDDVEIYGEYKTASTSSINRYMCVARGNTETTATPSAYYLLALRNTTLRLFSKTPGGSLTQLADPSHGLTLSTSAWYKYRMRLNGSSIRARVWLSTDAEPGTWQVDITDTSLSGTGVVGVMRSNNTTLSEWRYFGVGTNGDAAPTSAGSGTTPVDRDADLRWALLAAAQRDADVRWALLTAAQADLDVRWAALQAAQNDADLRWDLICELASVTNDLNAQWALLAALHRDADLRWAALTAAQADLDARWLALAQVYADADLRWDMLSDVLTAARDLELRWSALAAVVASLDAQWAAVTPVLADADLRWQLAIAVASDLDARWDILAGLLTAEHDLDLRWALVASTATSLTLTWRLGDGADPHPVTIHRLAAGRRIHPVPPERRIHPVPPAYH